MKLLNANLLWYTGLLILLVHLIPGPVFSQDRSKRKIIIGTFLPYKSQPDSSVKEKIEGELSRNFGLDGFEVRSVDSTAGTEEILSKLKSEEGSVFITGYYRKNAGVNLNLYCQIYNPETGFMIDALNVSDELEGLEGIRLPDEETKEDDSKIITKFVAKILTRIKLNSQKKERRENINEYVASSPISKDIKFNTRREDVKAEAEAVFKLLENQEVVTATRTKTKIKDAPAAVYVVTAQMIRERGYRTLEDALADLPGFDFQHSGLYPDLIHQRGLVGSMQRTLLYVDGIPDNNINENAMLGGSVRFPLANIERIEVVSGPASALYGANAFNGIINIITKDGETNPGNHIDATYGTYEKKYTNPGASASFSARGTSGGENPIQYSVGGYYYKTDGPNFGGIQGLDPPNNGATKANPNYNYHYDPVYYYGRKACGDSTCKPDSKSIGYFWSPGYNVSQEETYNVTAKFSRGGFRFETINWQYLQGEGIFGNGTQQIDTKERGFESGKYDSRNLARAYGIGSGILTNTVKDKNGKVVSTSYGDQGTKGSNWDFQNQQTPMRIWTLQ